jgi:WD40 repeat protein
MLYAAGVRSIPAQELDGTKTGTPVFIPQRRHCAYGQSIEASRKVRACMQVAYASCSSRLRRKEPMVLHEKHQNTHQLHWTPDTRALLMVLREQLALRIDHVPRFLTLFEAPSDKAHLSHRKSAAHHLVERLQRAGLLRVRHWGASRLSWLWLTKKGWQASGMTSAWTPPPRRKLPTLHATNELRLRLTESDPQLVWISRQQLRQASSPRHWPALPTAEVITGAGERIALHVVLHMSGNEEQIMIRMREQLEREAHPGNSSSTALWYYAPTPVAARLRAARARLAKELGKEIAHKIGIFTYPLIKGQVIYRVHHSPVRALAWSPDGKSIAAAERGAMHVWEVATGHTRLHLTPQEADPCSLGWSASGIWIALADADARLWIWKAVSDEEMPIMLHHASFDPIMGLAWSPTLDNRLAVCFVSGRLRMYDASTGLVLWESYTQHGAESLAWSPDGTCLAVGGKDPSVSLFDATTGEPLRHYPKHRDAVRALCWSADSQLLASGSGEAAIAIWEAVTGKKRRTIRSRLGNIEQLAWSKDGNRLACAGSDPCVEVWETRTGRRIFTYADHADAITSLAWSPDGSRLASASEDGTVHVYPAAREMR